MRWIEGWMYEERQGSEVTNRSGQDLAMPTLIINDHDFAEQAISV